MLGQIIIICRKNWVFFRLNRTRLKRKRNISILKRKTAIQIDILKNMRIELAPPITRTRYLKVKF